MSEKKKYKQFTLILDVDNDAEDKKIYAWMKKHRTKRLKYSDMLRDAMSEYIKNFGL